MKEDKTQEQLEELILEAKHYFELQKEYLKLTMAEQLTHFLAKTAFMLIGGVLCLFIIVFLGLALVHWIGSAIGNIAVCYAVFALLLVLLFFLVYHNRRRMIILPIAKMMSQVFLATEGDAANKDNNDEEE